MGKISYESLSCIGDYDIPHLLACSVLAIGVSDDISPTSDLIYDFQDYTQLGGRGDKAISLTNLSSTIDSL